MGYKDITAGEKLAKAKSAKIVKSSKGTPGFEVEFEFLEPATANVETLKWTGWLSNAAIENTMNTLVNVLGFNGNDEVVDDGSGNLKDFNALDWNKQVKLVVNAEEYEGKTRMRISWVNNVGGGGFQTSAAAETKQMLNEVGFTAAFLAAKQKSNLKPKPAEQQPLSAEVIPF